MGLYDLARNAATLASKLNNIELVNTLMQVQQAALDLDRDNAEMRREVEQLRARLDLRDRLELRQDMYWLPGDPVPFCTRCLDAENKSIRLHINSVDANFFRCPSCDTVTRRSGQHPSGPVFA